MPRKRRFYLPGFPVHIVQRGHSRRPVFFKASDRQRYLEYLAAAAGRYQCRIHAYVLMTNHVHLLVSPDKADGIVRMMQALGSRYVRYINVREGTSGSLWEGRYYACLIQDDRYLLACMRYIELNPVRAGIVESPVDYRWSSYPHNGLGRIDVYLSPHEVYTSMGSTPEIRSASYRALFDEMQHAGDTDDIRRAWRTGTPLVSGICRKFIEQRLKRRLGQVRRGRPGAAGKAARRISKRKITRDPD